MVGEEIIPSRQDHRSFQKPQFHHELVGITQRLQEIPPPCLCAPPNIQWPFTFLQCSPRRTIAVKLDSEVQEIHAFSPYPLWLVEGHDENLRLYAPKNRGSIYIHFSLPLHYKAVSIRETVEIRN